MKKNKKMMKIHHVYIKNILDNNNIDCYFSFMN
jgi:hypothetical protein